MKFLLLIILVLKTSAFAESIFNGKCVEHFYTLDSSTLNIEYSNGKTIRTSESKAKIEELVSNINKFKYDKENSQCVAIMSDSNQAFLDSLIGILIGFTLLFFVSLVTIKVATKS